MFFREYRNRRKRERDGIDLLPAILNQAPTRQAAIQAWCEHVAKDPAWKGYEEDAMTIYVIVACLKRNGPVILSMRDHETQKTEHDNQGCPAAFEVEPGSPSLHP
jgi:hypothetical protein